MRIEKYKVLGRTPNAVLLEAGDKIYEVLNIENEIIYFGVFKNEAEKVLNEYDIEKVRKARKESFERWLKENAEA